MRTIRIAVLLLLIGGCSTISGMFGGNTLVVTGESLKASGNEFVKVSATYKQGCDVTKTIAPAECASFRKFGEGFQKSFPLAVSLWEAARVTGNAELQKSTEGPVSVLQGQLQSFKK